MKLEHVHATHVGLVRSLNQDALLCQPERGIFLVADGMGGEQAGEDASAQVVKTVGETSELLEQDPPSSPSQLETRLSACLHKANRDVLQIAVAEPEKTGLGSTASLLCLYRGLYVIAHVGDSRIYLARDGNVKLLTHDHSLVWVLYEQGVLTRSQMDDHPDRNLLTQSIGSNREINVETTQNRAAGGDVYLLCSDGLTSYIKEDEVFSILGAGQSLQETADALIQAALDAGGGDNVSVILARVVELEPRDNWESEDTAPTKINHPVAAVGDVVTTPLVLDKSVAAGAGQGLRRWLRWPIVLPAAVVLLALIFFLFRHGVVTVYLGPPDQQELKSVEVVSADGSQIVSPVLKDKQDRTYLELPSSKQFWLRVRRNGLVEYEQELIVPPSAHSIPQQAWVQHAKLTLNFPPGADITSLELKAEDKPAQDPESSHAWTAQELKGHASIVVSLRPEIVYSIQVQAAGGKTFKKRVDFPPQANRTVDVIFPAAGEQPK